MTHAPTTTLTTGQPLAQQMRELWRGLLRELPGTRASGEASTEAICSRLSALATDAAVDLEHRILLMEPVLSGWLLIERLKSLAGGTWSDALRHQELPPYLAWHPGLTHGVTLARAADGHADPWQLSGRVVQPGPCRGQSVCVLASEGDDGCGNAVLVWLTPSQQQQVFPPGDAGRRPLDLCFDHLGVRQDQRWALRTPGHALGEALQRGVAARLGGLVIGALHDGLHRVREFTRQRVLYGKPIVALPLVQAELEGVATTLHRLDTLWRVVLRTSDAAPKESALWEECFRYLLAWQSRRALKRMTSILGARHYLREGEHAPVHRLCQGLRSFSLRFGGDGRGLWPWIEALARTDPSGQLEASPAFRRLTAAAAERFGGVCVHRDDDTGFCEARVREFAEVCLTHLGSIESTD